MLLTVEMSVSIVERVQSPISIQTLLLNIVYTTAVTDFPKYFLKETPFNKVYEYTLTKTGFFTFLFLAGKDNTH